MAEDGISHCDFLCAAQAFEATVDKWFSLDNSVIVGGCIDQISGQKLGFPADRLLSLKPSLSSNHSLCSQCTISNALGMSDHNSKTRNFDICACK